MFLTLDILEKFGACQKGKSYLKKNYPNGAELSELILDQNIPFEMLHWGKEHLRYTPGEYQLYIQRINVINSVGCYQSQNVHNSSFVSKSSGIYESEGVFSSEEVRCSKDIVKSKNVTNSKQIFYSSMVDSSQKVVRATNVTNSENIVGSSFIMDSKNIYKSEDIFDSENLRVCNSITNCYFCADCSNLTNSLFCFGQKEGEYLVFNRLVNKKRFDVIFEQYKKFIGAGLVFVESWPENLLKKQVPEKKKIASDFYSILSKDFFAWVSTLPGYSSELFNKIIGKEF